MERKFTVVGRYPLQAPDMEGVRYVARVETTLVEDRTFAYYGERLVEPEQFAKLLFRLGHSDREIAIVLFLDESNMPIGYDRWNGGMDFVMLDPRHIFKLMALLNAPKLAIAHNHPNFGKVEPSIGDSMLCLQLSKLCKIMGWELADFLVIGPDNWFSFKKEKRPPFTEEGKEAYDGTNDRKTNT
jgi:DNA repair protein RadC